MTLRPVPDRDSARWWAAVAEHRLLLQRCTACGHLRLLPRAGCGRCGSFDWTDQEAAGTGTVVSWTVVHRAVDGRPTPYVVVLVRLDEADHLVLPGAWAGEPDGSGLAAGLPVRAEYVDLEVPDGTDRVALVAWAACRASA
ncbi:Zn-ribbon domain-containing OB-fold protein [Pseudonocardia lutea]|uniref:Zn-ribbon domain-containing OB-fold protein n=1 Tax=Pseudonocardia lutea TaxID=2172015 RepID=A0ABW1IDJ9_9PSEU